MLRSIGKQSEESVESVLKKKRKATISGAAWGRGHAPEIGFTGKFLAALLS